MSEKAFEALKKSHISVDYQQKLSLTCQKLPGCSVLGAIR